MSRATPNTAAPSTLAVAIALLTVYIVWGSTYMAIAVMIQTLPPLVAAGARFLVAGILMLGAVAAYARWRRGEPMERPTAAHWRSAAIVGVLLLLGGNGGVVLAELFVPSSLAAVLIATVPIWMVAIESVIDRRLPGPIVLAGLAGGILGVAILIAPVDPLSRVEPIGIGLLIIAEISWAAGSIYAQRAPMPRSAFLATGMEMVAGGVALGLTGLVIGELGRTDFGAISFASAIALAYLVVFGSLVAFTAYTWLLANVPASTAGTYAYVNPVVAVALGAIILSEPITLRTLIATAIILIAVVAIISGRRAPRADATVAVSPAETADEAAR